MYWIITVFLYVDNVKQLQGYLGHILECICMNMVMAQKYILIDGSSEEVI